MNGFPYKDDENVVYYRIQSTIDNRRPSWEQFDPDQPLKDSYKTYCTKLMSDEESNQLCALGWIQSTWKTVHITFLSDQIKQILSLMASKKPDVVNNVKNTLPLIIPTNSKCLMKCDIFSYLESLFPAKYSLICFRKLIKKSLQARKMFFEKGLIYELNNLISSQDISLHSIIKLCGSLLNCKEIAEYELEEIIVTIYQNLFQLFDTMKEKEIASFAKTMYRFILANTCYLQIFIEYHLLASFLSVEASEKTNLRIIDICIYLCSFGEQNSHYLVETEGICIFYWIAKLMLNEDISYILVQQLIVLLGDIIHNSPEDLNNDIIIDISFKIFALFNGDLAFYVRQAIVRYAFIFINAINPPMFKEIVNRQIPKILIDNILLTDVEDSGHVIGAIKRLLTSCENEDLNMIINYILADSEFYDWLTKVHEINEPFASCTAEEVYNIINQFQQELINSAT